MLIFTADVHSMNSPKADTSYRNPCPPKPSFFTEKSKFFTDRALCFVKRWTSGSGSDSLPSMGAGQPAISCATRKLAGRYYTDTLQQKRDPWKVWPHRCLSGAEVVEISRPAAVVEGEDLLHSQQLVDVKHEILAGVAI
ncbi:hypothetical protein Mapa_008985 [Marchantia paleacea]|nr:hypothetical protein Mapa_008985 [Marchantia paleacea]